MRSPSIGAALVLGSLAFGVLVAGVGYVGSAYQSERLLRSYDAEAPCLEHPDFTPLVRGDIPCKVVDGRWVLYVLARLARGPAGGDIATAAISAGVTYAVAAAFVLSQRALRRRPDA